MMKNEVFNKREGEPKEVRCFDATVQVGWGKGSVIKGLNEGRSYRVTLTAEFHGKQCLGTEHYDPDYVTLVDGKVTSAIAQEINMPDPVFTKDNLPDDETADWGTFRKTHLTKMVRIEGPFEVETKEGKLSCPDGYLAIDAEGWPYPISAADHAQMYEQTDEPA